MSCSNSNSEEYEVERLMQKRLKGGEEQYLVKWAGYPDSEATWEPRSSLQNCHRLLFEFEQRTQKGGAKSRCARSKSTSQAAAKPTRTTGAIFLAGKRELAALIQSGDPALVFCVAALRPSIDAHLHTPTGTFLRLKQLGAAEPDSVYLRDKDCRRLLPQPVREYFAHSV